MVAGSALRRDDGFSIAEVVFAAAIMFFVLTAMVGLIGASQTMSVMAKDKTTLTNAIAEHIDHIRAMDYKNIATPPGGTVPSSEDKVYGPYTIHFTNRVVFADGAGGEYLRTVYVKASCTIRGRVYKTSATVHIRNPKNDTTAASIGDPDAPGIEYTTGATDENAILYGKLVYPDNTSINLETQAKSSDDVITEVRYILGSGGLVRTDAGALGTDAVFPFTPGIATANTSTRWDTTQAGVSDGLQKVVVQATDSRGRTSTTERQFVVDNVAPAQVTSVTPVPMTSTSTRVLWGAAADPPVTAPQVPVTFAVEYPISLRKEPTWGGDYTTWPIVWSGTFAAGSGYIDGMFNAGPLNTTIATDPFSRYRLRMGARSPRGLSSTRETAYFVSAPQVHSGTTYTSKCTTEYVKSGNNISSTYTVTMYISEPTFPITSSATLYKFYARDDAASGWWEFTPVSGVTVTDVGSYWQLAFTYKELRDSRNLWLKVGVNVTPVGGASAGYVTSNAIGVTPVDSTKTTGSAITAVMNPDTTWTK